jgi:hypothetical protein
MGQPNGTDVVVDLALATKVAFGTAKQHPSHELIDHLFGVPALHSPIEAGDKECAASPGLLFCGGLKAQLFDEGPGDGFLAASASERRDIPRSPSSEKVILPCQHHLHQIADGLFENHRCQELLVLVLTSE